MQVWQSGYASVFQTEYLGSIPGTYTKMKSRLIVPFKVAKRAEARAAAGKSYWDATKKRAESPEYQAAVKEFFDVVDHKTNDQVRKKVSRPKRNTDCKRVTRKS